MGSGMLAFTWYWFQFNLELQSRKISKFLKLLKKCTFSTKKIWSDAWIHPISAHYFATSFDYNSSPEGPRRLQLRQMHANDERKTMKSVSSCSGQN